MICSMRIIFYSKRIKIYAIRIFIFSPNRRLILLLLIGEFLINSLSVGNEFLKKMYYDVKAEYGLHAYKSDTCI